VFVHRLHVTSFKPFSELTVMLDGSPRLVMACGQNGTGKSSLIDALSLWRQQQHWGGSDPRYYTRGGREQAHTVELSFHHEGEAINGRLAIYVRTAQRVSIEFSIGGVGQPTDLLEDPGPRRSIDVDARVEQNYIRLVAESVAALWDRATPERTTGDIVSTLVGEIGTPLGRLLPGLIFEGPSLDPLMEGTFEFTKGSVQRYAYKMLSGGEKAVFDLLLDFAMKRTTFTDTIYCVDEPELHVNASIHGKLLDEMLGLIPDGCQLILATHSAGMLARARAMYDEDHSSVAFLDFDGHDFDRPVALNPVAPDRTFWRRQLTTAFGDFADLLAPRRVVLCEGEPAVQDSARASFDARCYEAIFGDEMPDTAFMSVGSSDEVERERLQLGERLTALVDGVETVRVIDRDARSEQEIEDAKAKGVRVLSRRNLECYLLDDDVLGALCQAHCRPQKALHLSVARDEAMAYAVEQHNAPIDNLKRVRGDVVTLARRLLSITQGGNSPDTFLRDTLAPLLEPSMGAYQELRRDLFGPAAQRAA
jgi:predicted ATPase